MKTFAALAVVVVVSVWAVVSLAQENAAPPTPPAPAPASPPAAGAEAPPAKPPPAGSDDEFIPTEELSADEAVTFPVDI